MASPRKKIFLILSAFLAMMLFKKAALANENCLSNQLADSEIFESKNSQEIKKLIKLKNEKNYTGKNKISSIFCRKIGELNPKMRKHWAINQGKIELKVHSSFHEDSEEILRLMFIDAIGDIFNVFNAYPSEKIRVIVGSSARQIKEMSSLENAKNRESIEIAIDKACSIDDYGAYSSLSETIYICINPNLIKQSYARVKKTQEEISLEALVKHEALHAFQSQILNKKNFTLVPLWILEGIATYFESDHVYSNSFTDDYLISEIKKATRNDNYKLYKNHGVEFYNDDGNYITAAVAVARLIKKHGGRSIVDFMDEVEFTGEINEPFEKNFNISLVEFERNFEKKPFAIQ